MFFVTGLILVSTILNIAVYYLRKHQEEDYGERKNSLPLLPDQLCRRFSLTEIKLATGSFDESLVIGKGGFGKVYKGIIDDEASTVAIKRLKFDSNQGALEFWTEIEMLSKFRHSRLVSLIGYCEAGPEMILVYEYMPGGTLADHLHKSKRLNVSNSPLSWVQRLEICIGAARGLDYLHTGTSIKQRVIHRDVKSSNILLDENLAAKISDFGLSRIGPANQASTTHVYTDHIKGTFGYMDEQYFLTQRLTRKSDVYAFGVVLFEVLCGRPAVDSSLDEEQHSLAGWASRCTREGTINQIIDPCLRGQILPDCLEEFVKIAYKCLLNRPKDRPTMAEVVARLEFALALQEGMNSSVLEGGETVNSTGAYDSQVSTYGFGEKEVVSTHEGGGHSSTEQEVITHSGGDEHSATQQEVTSVGNGYGNQEEQIDGYRQSGDADRIQHLRKGARKKTFIKKVWSMFSAKSPAISDGDTSVDALEFHFDTIRLATDNFSKANKLLEDGTNSVYKGWLQNGQGIAVESFDNKYGNLHQGFRNEVLLLVKLQHGNLVRLLGYCVEGTRMLLIYDFVPYARLDHFLADPVRRAHLNWDKRYNIIVGVAQGLLYLHECSPLRIIHRDVTPHNIMLDESLDPKISGFQLATKLAMDETYIDLSTTVVAVTLGYSAPELLLHSCVSPKADVYSFGVLVLEIIGGQRSYDFNHYSSGYHLESVRRNWWKGMTSNLIDPALVGHSSVIMRYIQIGLLCVEENVDHRPTMASVVLMLSSSSVTLPFPTKPMTIFDDTSELDYEKDTETLMFGDYSPETVEDFMTELYPR